MGLDNSKIQLGECLINRKSLEQELAQTLHETSEFNLQFQIQMDYEKNMTSLRKDLEQYKAEVAIIGQEAEELAKENKKFKDNDKVLRQILEDALAALEDISNRSTEATGENIPIVQTDDPSQSHDVKDTDLQIQTGDAEQAYDVPYFKNALRSETEVLQALCSTWKIEAKTFSQLPDETQGLIRTAIGQSELLMAQRFNQFNGLIDDCEFKRGHKKTTTNDLAGYWDMVMYQINDVKERFHQLEVHWSEERPLKSTGSEKTKDACSAVVIRDLVKPCRAKRVMKSVIPVPRTKIAEFRSKITKSYLIKL